MLITTPKVNIGTIEVNSTQLPDGTTVTLLAHEGDEVFELDPTQETMLLAAIAEAERREVISAARLCKNFVSHEFTVTGSYC